MTAFHGDPITVDDLTLLRAIALVEGKVTTSSHVPSAIQGMVVETPGFEIIRTNEHLRGLLRAYLEANVAVESKTKDVMRQGAKNIVARMFGGAELKSLQDELAVLKAIRDEAFKPYEMLRKLTDIDNVLLQRKPY